LFSGLVPDERVGQLRQGMKRGGLGGKLFFFLGVTFAVKGLGQAIKVLRVLLICPVAVRQSRWSYFFITPGRYPSVLT
jgi:hypothetical protein